MSWLYLRAIEHPFRTLALGMLPVLLALPGLLRLELRTDGAALVPEDAAAVREDREIRELFDLEDRIAVVLESSHEDGIFNRGTLESVVALTRSFQKLVPPGEVVSLATEGGGRVKPGTLEFRPFLEPVPSTRTEMEALRRELFGLRILRGSLISAEGGDDLETFEPTATTILVGIDADEDRTRLYHEIRSLVEEREPGSDVAHVVGAPVAEAMLGRHLLEDLATLLPIVLSLMFAIFWLAFGSPTAAMLPLLEVGSCLVFVFGLMGFLGIPVYLTLAVLPVILTAIGIADEIHVFERYRRELRERGTELGACTPLKAALDDMWRPVLKTSLTSSVGFLSFTLSPLEPVRAFGLLAAVGIVFCMLWSLTVIPACLALLNPRHLATHRPQVESHPVARLTRAALTLRIPLLLATVVIVVIAPMGLARLTVQDSWIDGFSAESDFRRSTAKVNDLFNGVHILQVCANLRSVIPPGTEVALEFGDEKESARTPLRQLPMQLSVVLPVPVATTTEWLGRRIVIRGTRNKLGVDTQPAISPHPRIVDLDDLVFAAEITAAAEAENAESTRLSLTRDPDPMYDRRPMSVLSEMRFLVSEMTILDPAALRRLASLEDYLRGRTEEEVGGVIGPQDQFSEMGYLLHGRAPESRKVGDNARENRRVLEYYGAIRGADRRREFVTDDGTRAITTVFLRNANFVATERLIDGLKQFQQQHLEPDVELTLAGDTAVSQAMIEAIVETQTRSLLISLLGILVVTTVLGRSLLWGLLSTLPVSFAVLINFSLMGFAGIPLGVATSMFAGMAIGIGVDYAIHFVERARAARLATSQESLMQASAQCGPAILVDALALAVGFGILGFSQVPANGRLGLLVVSTMVTAFLATVVILPVIASWRRVVEARPSKKK